MSLSTPFQSQTEDSFTVVTQRGNTELSKLVHYQFSLESADPGIPLEAVKEKLWPVWERREAVLMEIKRKNVYLMIHLYFRDQESAKCAIESTSRKRMIKLLAQAERLKQKIQKASKEFGFEKYLGPNGQKQINIHYKPQECRFGCHKIVEKDEIEAHRAVCSNHKRYLEYQMEYFGSEARLNERPKPFVQYERDALDERAIENNYRGFMYGTGPIRLSKECFGNDPK